MDLNSKKPQEQQPNTIGAVVFTCYVLAALLLSAHILSRLNFMAHALKKRSGAKEKEECSAGLFPFALSKRLELAVALAVLSFSILSYQMLLFLIVSYRSWATASASTKQKSSASLRPSNVLLYLSVPNLMMRHIWTWLESSTLFLSFAQNLCDGAPRFWWTLNALAYSFVCSVYIAVEGTRRQIPSLWAYFALAQILPFSYMQNLFFVAVLLDKEIKNEGAVPLDFPKSGAAKPVSKSEMSKLWLPTPSVQVAVVLLYYITVLAMPYLGSSVYFMPGILATRALLGLPYLILRPSERPSWITRQETSVEAKRTGKDGNGMNLHERYIYAYACAISLGSFAFVFQTIEILREGDSMVSVFDGKTLTPAVAALGYDWVIGLASLAVWHNTCFLVGSIQSQGGQK